MPRSAKLTVKSWFLQDFHFADAHVVEWENTLAGLLDVLGDAVGDELVNQLFQVVGGDLTGHDLHHLLADDAHLVALGIAGLLDLVLPLLGETDAEHADEVTIRGLHVNIGLNQCLQHVQSTSKLVCCFKIGNN